MSVRKILAFVCQQPLVMTNYVKSLSWFMMLVRNWSLQPCPHAPRYDGPYQALLRFLEEIKTDYITVGDAGVFTWSTAMVIPLRPSTMLQLWWQAVVRLTSGDKRLVRLWGCFGAWNSICWTFKMPEILEIPAEVLVYGASVIHHSKRPLLQNYYNFTHIDDEKTRKRDLFFAEPSDLRATIPFWRQSWDPHLCQQWPWFDDQIDRIGGAWLYSLETRRGSTHLVRTLLRLLNSLSKHVTTDPRGQL